MIELESCDNGKLLVHITPTTVLPTSPVICVTGLVQKDLSLQAMVLDSFGDTSLDMMAMNKLVAAMHKFPAPFMV